MRAERVRRRWARYAAWIEVLWSCRCDYTNVASYRCYFCGSRPPRELRDALEPVAAARAPEG
jgi:hypothetical protein